METAVAIYLYLLSAMLALFVLWQANRGTVELLSMRNVALAGFVIFQLTSAAIRLWSGYFETFTVTDPGRIGFKYSIMCTVFLVIALLAYSSGRGVKKAAWKLGANKPAAGTGFQLGMAVALTGLAILFRFAIIIPNVAIVASMVGVGYSAVACGLVGWTWARHIANPVMLLFLLLILAANFVTVIWGEFGRRNLVAILAALIWGVYYARWRYLPTRKLMTRLALLSAGPVILVALYTSVRSADSHDRTALDHVKLMMGGNLTEGMALLLDGQGTGTAAMWCVENFPENFEYDHLLTVRYFVMLPVPRAWWPEKPKPLSTKMAAWAKLNQINRDKVKLPAGIVGNAAAEGGWYALVIYAILSGLFIRFFDEIIRSNPISPFVVLPVGCQLGQVLGFARGETSVFALQYVLSFIGVWVTMAVVAWALVAPVSIPLMNSHT